MGVPRAIQEQETKADQLVTQLAKGELVDVIVDDPSKLTEKKPEQSETVKQEESTPSQAQPGPSQTDYDALNQRYSVLQGKYNHETAELRRTLDQANSTITRQNAMILDLHTRVNALERGGDSGGEDGDVEKTGRKVSSGQQAGPKKLNPDDFEGYGSEMRDLVDGFNSLLEENERLKGNVAKVQEADSNNAWANFTVRMAQLVPDWEALNYDEGFLGWLKGPASDFDDTPRKARLDQYAAQLDADRCAKFFEAYKRGQKAPQSGASASGPKKEDIIQPSASASGADSPIPGANNTGEVSADAYNQAVKDYTQKRISYEEFEKISDAYQRGLAKKTGRK